MQDTGVKKRSPDEFQIIKNDFIQALDRLVNNMPRSARNIQRMSDGKLEITVSSVADEAGRSRSLIARSDNKYRDIRELILSYRDKVTSRRKNNGSRLEKIKAENFDLKKRLELSLEAQAQLLFENRQHLN